MRQSITTTLLAVLLSMPGIKVSASIERFDISLENKDGVTIYYKWVNNRTELAVCRDIYNDASIHQTYPYWGKVFIPETVEYNGITYRVTSIYDHAFRYCSGLTSVTIPNSVTSIGEFAFEDCSGLISVTIPNGVTSIGWGAFYGCSGLTSVTIGNSVTSIGMWAFRYCSGLTSVTIPNSVTSIRSTTFSGCSGLTSIIVEEGNAKYDSRNNCNALIETESDKLLRGCKNTTIPNSVTSIGEWAFDNCSGLTYITIPNSVTSIGNYAFLDCSGLTSITIPNSVTSIVWGAFQGCSGLASIIVEEDNTKYDSRNYCNAIIETVSNVLIAGCKNTTIPNSVTSIEVDAFHGCSGLTSVTIPYSVTSIGRDAFSGCSGLTSVTIPNGVISIGAWALSNCSGLTSVTIPNSVTSIGKMAFGNCIGLKTVISKIENPFAIDNSVFNGIPSNAQLIVPKGTKEKYQSTAGWNQFTNIVENVGIGDVFESNGVYYKVGENNTVSVTSGNMQYSGDVVIPSLITYRGTIYSVTSIGESAFYGCSGLTSVTIPNSVTSIGVRAFQGCSGLTSVTIPNRVASIGLCTFSGCSGLTSVTIPNSVTSIGECSFVGCSGLTFVTIPNSVTSIGERAFESCSGLTSVTIPNSVTSIGVSAFRNCCGLTSIKVESGNLTYDSRNSCNAIIKKSTNTLIAGCKNTIIPNNVTSIGNSAFYGCSGLTSVTIPNNVTSIDDYAFLGCSGLTSVAIPNNVTSIGLSAFNECSGLTSVTIPNSVTSIGVAAFRNCCGLTSVTIPSSVTYIGKDAFYGCSGLKTIYSELDSPIQITYSEYNKYAEDYIDYYPFSDDIFTNAILYVPKNTKSTYLATEGWNNFTNIVEVGEIGSIFEVDGIYYKVGENNTVSVISGSRKYSGEVVIPSHITYGGTTYSVTSIGAYTFDGGSDITYLSIPYSIKSIGEYAFRGCGSSMTVNIADLKSWCNMKLGNEHASPLSSAGKMLVNNVETTSLDIPETVTTINAFTFYQCSCITSLNIPGTVTSIKSSAFEDCDYLTSLTLNEGLQSIGGSAFEGCKSLSALTIPGTVNTIKVNAFKNCSVLTSIISEIENPFEINNNVFNGIPSYAQLIVPKGKKSVYQATAGWNQFTNIVEVGGVGYKFEADGIYYKIGENNTVSVTYGDTKYSGDVVIPSQVVYEGKTYSVTSIGVMAFYECSELTSITIPNSVKSIDDEAFSYSGITSVIIPESVWGIGWRAFCGCGLTSITFLGSVWIDKEAFMNCGALNAVHISDLESFLKNEYEESYEESNPLEYAHHLYLNGVEIKDLVIPNTITEIRHHAFYECRSLTSVTIPNSVTSIDECAFGGCSGLTSVVIGNGVKHILYSYAFLNCENLKEMILSQAAYENGIPESVTKFTTYSKDPMRVVVTSKGATSATMKIYPIDDSGNTNVDKCYTVTMLGLTPEQYIKWKLDDENYGIISEKTSALTLTTQPAQPTSTTKARLTAMVNEADDDQHYGFEWLRNEAPSNMPPNKVSAPLYEGKIMGSLSGLNPDIYYKYRPFYQSDSGETYYGEWIAFLTGDANVFFEPETHTKEATDVTDVSAQLAGVWIEGTEDTEEKGFEYWTVSIASTRAAGSDAKTVAVSGNQTTITIDDLEGGKEYGYRTYVKTASGTTYGEEKTFKTVLMGDVNSDGDLNEADVDDVASHIMGHSPTGFNKEKADMNHDGEVNAVDLVEIVKIVNSKK